jgi:hypothetical protein
MVASVSAAASSEDMRTRPLFVITYFELANVQLFLNNQSPKLYFFACFL